MSLTPLNACSPVMRGWGSVRALYLEIRVRGRSVALSVSMRACLCFDCTYLHVRAPYTSDGATHLLYRARALSLSPPLASSPLSPSLSSSPFFLVQSIPPASRGRMRSQRRKYWDGISNWGRRPRRGRRRGYGPRQAMGATLFLALEAGWNVSSALDTWCCLMSAPAALR